MNKVISRMLTSAFIFAIAHTSIFAQSTSSNIKLQPAWGPAGYTRADYYYLPHVESYYSVTTHQYIYLSGGRWIYSQSLPPKYKNYDLYSGYKIVLNKPRPYLNFNEDRVQYEKYKNYNGKRQDALRDTRYKQQNTLSKQDNKPRNGNGGDYGP